MKTIKTDLCIIGAGAGGLGLAAGAVQMGAKVVLVESGKMGGDCLNYGCVPSKSLIKAGYVAHQIRNSERFGIKQSEPNVDMSQVEAHIKGVISGIAPHDSVERFEELGCTVIQEEGSFLDTTTVKAGDYNIKARYFIVATGSHAFVPGIPGLDMIPYLTNETIFDIKEPVEHLLVVGGGPIGSEISQSYRRLGSRVSIISDQYFMPRGDRECVKIVQDAFEKEEISIYENSKINRFEKAGNMINASISRTNGENFEIKCSHVLVAAGRRPVINALNLTSAKVKFDGHGIKTDAKLRTSNKKVFAIGDCASGPQFTHIAGYHSGIVIRNILFKMPAKINYKTLPWVTYTDPEYAHTGLDEAQAKEKYGQIKVVKWSFEENDRARAERETEGMIKVITTKKGVIVGCSIVGPHAGELLGPWILAIQEDMKIGKIASMIFPYPTLSEISKRAAGQYYTSALFSNRTKRIVKLLLKI